MAGVNRVHRRTVLNPQPGPSGGAPTLTDGIGVKFDVVDPITAEVHKMRKVRYNELVPGTAGGMQWVEYVIEDYVNTEVSTSEFELIYHH